MNYPPQAGWIKTTQILLVMTFCTIGIPGTKVKLRNLSNCGGNSFACILRGEGPIARAFVLLMQTILWQFVAEI